MLEPVTDRPMWRDARLDDPTSCHLEMDDDKRSLVRDRKKDRERLEGVNEECRQKEG